jgi:replicative DNA helicase
MMDEISAAVRAHERTHGSIDIIFIDYLQIVRSPSRKNRTRIDDVTEISGDMKALAKEYSCPVVVLSQLSRESEKRSNKRPMPSDLRESGAIEQDADIIIGLYRPGVYYDEAFEDEDYKHMNDPLRYSEVIEMIVMKNRNGGLGKIHEYYDVTNGRFEAANPFGYK